jgi:hypothetical protein
MKRHRLAALLPALTLFLSPASPGATFADAGADLFNNGLTNLDITSVEVTNDATNLSIAVSTSSFQNWTKYLIWIDTPAAGDAPAASNPWNRPASLAAGSGSNFFIGSWVDSATNNAQLWSFSGSWSQTSTFTNAVSGNTVTFTIPLSSLGISPGDLINIDVATSGGGGGDPGVDHLSIATQSTSGWGVASTGGTMPPYTIATLEDSDSDGLPDAWELTYFGNLDQGTISDPDSDTLTNFVELEFGTNPALADTDADGLNDGAEILTHATDPLVADTDGDGINDGAEVSATPPSDPKVYNPAAMVVAGSFSSPQWAPEGIAGQTIMTAEGTDLDSQYRFTLDFAFTAVGEAISYKYTNGVAWPPTPGHRNWGAGDQPGTFSISGGNLAATITATGIHRFSVDVKNLTQSFTRRVFFTYEEFAEAYGITDPAGDDDGDTLDNVSEFAFNTDPFNPDTDGDFLTDDIDADPLVDDNIDGDLDNDGLADGVETDTGIFVSASDTGSDPLVADTDGDGYSDGDEVNASNLPYQSNPNVKNYASMTVPGTFTNPQWVVNGSAGNTMVQGDTSSITAQYDWTLDYKIPAPGAIEYKYAANGGWSENWGSDGPNGGTNFAATVTASGVHTFAFNNQTLAQSFVRKTFPDAAAFLAAYGLSADPAGDADTDGVGNSDEFTANSDPTNADTDGDGNPDNTDDSPLSPSRTVSFAVNMAVQEAKGLFDPATDSVVVAGSFNGWNTETGAVVLSDTDPATNLIYVASASVPGLLGASAEYKFILRKPSGASFTLRYEETAANRVFSLGAGPSTQTLPTVYFADDSKMPGYAAWATTYAGGGAADADFDKDGVRNGVEYFLGTGASGSTQTPHPVARTVSWPKSPDASDATFAVKTSTDLVTWTDVTAGADTSDPAFVRYTLPAGSARIFVRLEVSVP